MTWDESAQTFQWKSTDMPAGWIGTGFNRKVDKDTFDNAAFIKDDKGQVHLDVEFKKTRIK
jgi:hypothetical protein